MFLMSCSELERHGQNDRNITASILYIGDDMNLAFLGKFVISLGGMMLK